MFYFSIFFLVCSFSLVLVSFVLQLKCINFSCMLRLLILLVFHLIFIFEFVLASFELLKMITNSLNEQ